MARIANPVDLIVINKKNQDFAFNQKQAMEDFIKFWNKKA